MQLSLYLATADSQLSFLVDNHLDAADPPKTGFRFLRCFIKKQTMTSCHVCHLLLTNCLLYFSHVRRHSGLFSLFQTDLDAKSKVLSERPASKPVLPCIKPEHKTKL